jgi:ABC-type amino acid transport substrate-binding protein
MSPALLAVVAVISGCRDSSDTWLRIQGEGTIRVGLDPTYPPFESLADGELQGIDYDLANALANDLGLGLNFSYFGYDGLYDALYTGQVDALLSAMVVLPERTKDFSYTTAYFDAGQILMSRVGGEVPNPDALTGMTVAVELGAEGHTIANQWKRNETDLTVTPYKSVEEALEAVVSGDADAAVVDSISGRLFAANHPNLAPSDQYITTEPFAMVVRSRDEELLNHLNESLERLRVTGAVDLIMRKWLDSSDAKSQ